jgi:hypothetical protein
MLTLVDFLERLKLPRFRGLGCFHRIDAKLVGDTLQNFDMPWTTRRYASENRNKPVVRRLILGRHQEKLLDESKTSNEETSSEEPFR